MNDFADFTSIRKKRPVLVVSRYSHWRWTLLLESVCHKFHEEGVEVLQVGECSPADENAGRLHRRSPGISRINIPTRVSFRRNPLGYLQSHRRFHDNIEGIIEAASPRAVVFENPDLTVVMHGISKRFPALPLVYWGTELSCRPLHMPFRLYERRLAPSLSGVVMNHPERIRILKDRVKCDIPSVCIPNTLSRLKQGAGNGQRFLRDQFARHNPEVSLIILYQGIISRKQAISEIIDALTLVPGHIGFAFGCTVGNSRYINRIRSKIKSLGLKDRVIHPDWVSFDKLSEMTASADIGIVLIKPGSLNTLHYASSKLYNYLQAGLPVIGSHLTSLREIIEREKIGVAVDPDSPEHIAEGIRRLDDSALRDELRANARIAFDKRLCLESYWEKHGNTLFEWTKSDGSLRGAK